MKWHKVKNTQFKMSYLNQNELEKKWGEKCGSIIILSSICFLSVWVSSEVPVWMEYISERLQLTPVTPRIKGGWEDGWMDGWNIAVCSLFMFQASVFFIVLMKSEELNWAALFNKVKIFLVGQVEPPPPPPPPAALIIAVACELKGHHPPFSSTVGAGLW